MTLRVGIIGASWSLVGHLPAWRNLAGVEIAAICTAHEDTARAAATAHGIPKAYWDFRDLIADPDIDIIDIGTKPDLRFDMVMAALAAGKHVINANPFALTMEKAQAQLAAQQSAGRVGLVEAQFQWLPQFTYIKELIASGYIGRPFGVRVRCDYPLVRHTGGTYPFVARAGYANYTWLADPASGASALRNMGAHCLHGMIYLMGNIASVSAELETCLPHWVLPDQEVRAYTHDTALLALRFENGIIGRLETSYVVADGRGFELEIFGEEGRLRLTSPSGFPDATNAHLTGARTSLRGMTDVQEAPLDIPVHHWQIDGQDIQVPEGARVVVPLTRMFHAMAARIRDAQGFDGPDFAQACHVHAVIEAAEAASATGLRRRIL